MPGTVYKIHSLDLSASETYVGSTTDIRRREHEHKRSTEDAGSDNYMRPVYQYIRANGGWGRFQVTPIETVEFQDVIELRARERYWIETMRASLNQCIPTRTDAEYRAANRDYMLQRNRAYRQANLEAIKAKQREYREANCETIAQKDNARKAAHNATTAKNKGTKVTCECGAVVSRGNLRDHRRTARHIAALAAQTIAPPHIPELDGDAQSRAEVVQQIS